MASIKDAKEVVALRESEYTVNGEYSGISSSRSSSPKLKSMRSTTTLMWQKLSAGLPDMSGSNVKPLTRKYVASKRN
jgi:hypothetical protein